MSRRSGQGGCIQQDGNWYVVRFWKDVSPEKRQRVREKICPITGPGKLSASERQRKAKEIIAASGADTVEHFEKVVRSNHGLTFREQAVIWMKQMQNRRRNPVAPSTLANWECSLRNWLDPNLGDMPLNTVNNLAMKNFVTKMVAGGLGPSAVRHYVQTAKMIVASAIDEEGEELYPRKWNHDFIDMPAVRNQKQPILPGDVVTKALALARKKNHRMLFVLCAAGGLRFGEALGIAIENISLDGSTIKIHQKAWRNQIHGFLKTDSGFREIDLHPSVTAMLRGFIGERTSGLLFRSRTGKPLSQSNILRRWLHPILAKLNQPKCGAHAFRRFRATWLRKNGIPEDLIHFWLGHAEKSITDIYVKLKEDLAFRSEWAEKAGLGFVIPPQNSVQEHSKLVRVWNPNCSFGPNGPKRTEKVDVRLAVSA